MKRYGIEMNPIEHQIKLIEEQEKKIREERAQPIRKRRTVKNYDITPPDASTLSMTLEPPPEIENSKTLNVAIIGAPNAGKSTLVNTIVGEKICAVSPTEHTTRDTVLGILSKDNTQILFHDTPGIIKNFNRMSHVREFVNLAWGVVREADVVLLVVDATNNNSSDTEFIVGQLEEQMLQLIKQMRIEQANQKSINNSMGITDDRLDDKEFILVINKVDLIRKKENLIQLISQLNEGNIFSDTFIISATSNIRVEGLTNYLIGKAKPGRWEFTENTSTDQTEFFRAEEIIKEKLYSKLRHEIPYSVIQSTVGWTNFKNGDLRIDHDFIVTKPSHKAFVLGKNGQTIKAIYLEAKKDLEKVFNRRVHLFLSVKQKDNTEHYEK
ncbi:hypothetical protein RB653_008501 [Dictyostelium firmibasis]|uniref:GTPase Era n=1 Tax=Dictyostelium firmibasis TaxID=79012 RepID=A0AAN7U071_9MYCE